MMKWINPACGGFDPCLLAGGALASIEKLNACGISGFFDVPSLTKDAMDKASAPKTKETNITK